jgi:hypothetical protein
VITDSPLILNSVYFDYYLEKNGYGTRASKIKFDDKYIEASRKFFNRTFKQFNNINFFVERFFLQDDDGEPYYPTFKQEGRNQNIAQALEIDDRIKKRLYKADPDYLSIQQHINYDSIEALADLVSGFAK